MPFAFKSKPTKPSFAVSVAADLNAGTSVAGDIGDVLLRGEPAERIENLTNEVRIITALNGVTLSIQNISNCAFTFPFNAKTVHLRDVNDSTLILLPTNTSILIHNCKRLKLVVAAQQIRVHDSSDLALYAHAKTAVIIENCFGIGMAPYRIEELGIQHLNNYTSGIAEETFSNSAAEWNECAVVQDFDCVIGKSPNWSIMDETKRVTFSISKPPLQHNFV